jgi:hypothetical protein
LEFVINKIMSIDKDAESYRSSIDLLLKEKQDEFESKIQDMKNHFQEESVRIKSEISGERILEAEHRAMSIRKEKEEQLNSINIKYQSNKLVIVEEVFSRIIKSL